MKGLNWRELCARDGMPVTAQAEEQLSAYAALIREWNRIVSLVSKGDLGQLEQRHVADSLSLARYVRAACGRDGSLLDIGSGAGFPAIPLKILLPDVAMTLVERSERKLGFLRKAIGRLGLQGISPVLGEFPRDVAEFSPSAITARAVEKPKRLAGHILSALGCGGTYLCQSGLPAIEKSQEFHVEHVQDAWKEYGIRRGELHLVRKN